MTKNSFSECLAGLTTDFTPVVDAGFFVGDYMKLDLSTENGDLSQKELGSSKDFEEYLDDLMRREGKKVGYGGYNEKRGLYRRSGLFSEAKDEDLIRNIHLGMDIWAPAGTSVHAILDGVVHSFRDNRGFGDYGPTIILEHRCQQDKFYTLYGHLSRTSLEDIEPGKKFSKGSKMAELGEASENGDYAPHLHFQVIRDLKGKTGDYPGVTGRRELREQLQNCPDPNLLLKIY